MLFLSLEVNGDFRKFHGLDKKPDYDDQYDDVNTVISELCEILAETGLLIFKVSGFGQEHWPVDIGVDLAVVLEQLPELYQSVVADNYPAELDFYEQGIQRKLIFSKLGEDLSITCASSTSWQPEPKTILINRVDFEAQILNLKAIFAEVVVCMFPRLSQSQLFKHWQNSFEAKEQGM